MRLQEDIGFKLVTDGEYNRTFWQRDFLLKFQNVQQVAAKLTVRFHSAAGSRDHSPPSLQVTGKLARPAGIFVDDFKFLKSVAHATPKITIPSPTTMHFRGGREAVDAKAYPHLEAILRRSRPRLPRRNPRPRRSRLPLLADRRGQFRLSVRSRTAEAGAQYRRRSGYAAEDLRPAAQRDHRRPARRHGGLHASVPRQFRRRLGCRGRLRPGRRTSVQRDRGRRLFPRIRFAARRRASRRCASCRKARSRYSAW